MVCSGKGIHIYITIHGGQGMVLVKDDCWKNLKIEKNLFYYVISKVPLVNFVPLGVKT